MAPQQPSRDPLDVKVVGPVSRALGRAARLHRAAGGELLKSTGLYPGQELLMMRLWESGPQRQADLAAEFGTDSGFVEELAAQAEKEDATEAPVLEEAVSEAEAPVETVVVVVTEPESAA